MGHPHLGVEKSQWEMIKNQWTNVSVSSRSAVSWYDLPVLQREPNRIMLPWLTVVKCS